MLTKDKFNSILELYAPDATTFVEIGAYDGETNSHTAHLADNGWVGTYFEPVLEYAAKCAERHKDNTVTVFPVAIGNPYGIKTMYVSEMLSTLNDEAYRENVKKLEWFKDTAFTERNVIAVSPEIVPECDLLVIDVEGSEEEILKGLLIRPKVLVIELHEESKEWQALHSTVTSLEILDTMGYKKVYSDDIDSVFIYA